MNEVEDEIEILTDDEDECLDRCEWCGKEFEEFAELGCEHCDSRVPSMGR
jgi:DNA-directed RNA polymerase subunit RPC12/RpoP